MARTLTHQMADQEIEASLRELEQEEAELRRRLWELEDIVQNAPGSHSAGVPSERVKQTEREIQGVVLRLVEIDRARQELTVASTMR